MNEKKVAETGKKLQKIGCALTLMFTIPIILTIFLGIPGLILGIILAVVGIVSLLSKKKKSEDK